MNDASNRQPESASRSNFFAILSFWIAFSATPTLLCGLAPTLFPKILADFLSLEKALPLWAGMASLGITIFWPLHLNQVDADQNPSRRARFALILQAFVLVALVSIPSLTMASGLSIQTRPAILKTALYLSSLGFSLLILSRWAFWLFPSGEAGRAKRAFWIFTLMAGLNGALPLFYLLSSVFRPQEFPLSLRLLAPSYASQILLDGGALARALGSWFSLVFGMGLILALVKLGLRFAAKSGLVAVACFSLLAGDVSADEDPVTLVKVEALLGSRARPGHSYPLRLSIGREAPGTWSGTISVRLGKRVFKKSLTVHGGTLNSPQQVDLTVVFNERQRLSFELESESGQRLTLPFRQASVSFVERDDVLVGAWGPESFSAAQAFVDLESGSTQPALRLSPALHQSLALGGDAIELVFVGAAESTQSRRLSLLRYVAQGGCVVLFGGGRQLRDAFPVTFVSQGSFFVGRLGSGLVLSSNDLVLSQQALGDLGQLLGPRLSADGRGRYDPEGILESYLRAPQQPKARLGLRFAFASVLVAVVLILTLFGFPRSAEAAGPHWIFRMLSQQVLGGVAFVVLALVLILRWALLPSSLTTIETLRVEEGVVGSPWVDQSSLLKLRSAIEVPEQTLQFSLSTSLRALETEESAAIGEEDWESLGRGQWRLKMPLRARQNSLFLTKDLRSLGRGLSLRPKDGSLLLTNGLTVPIRNVLVAQGERSVWIDSVKAGDEVTLRFTEKAWYDWMESELQTSLEKNLYYYGLPQRESYLERGGVILCQPDDDGLRRQIGDHGVELGATRLLLVTWLNQELKEN